jgi:CelD/BcsL family acetyltransferase involved in cellulose biosynthesis
VQNVRECDSVSSASRLEVESTLETTLVGRPSSSRIRHRSSAPSRGREIPSASWAAGNSKQLNEIAPFWQSLEKDCCSPMQHYIWSDACWATLPIQESLTVVVVKTGPRTGAIAPLLRQRGGLQRLRHVGVKCIHEPTDFLYSDDDALKTLASTLVELGSPMFLERIPADSPTVAAIQQAYRGRGKVFLRPRLPYPRIVLNEDWQEPERQLKPGRRSDLRRAIRKARQMGPLRFEVSSPKPNELGPLLEEALEVEAANWKGREGSAVAKDGLRGEFYRRYAVAASQSGILRLCFLRVGDRAAAMQFALECGGSFWLLKIGYREEFARCSPGTLLLAETIRYAASKGLSSYEFLGAAENWTRVWATDERASLSVRAYPLRWRGIAGLAADAGRWACERSGHALKDDE